MGSSNGKITVVGKVAGEKGSKEKTTIVGKLIGDKNTKGKVDVVGRIRTTNGSNDAENADFVGLTTTNEQNMQVSEGRSAIRFLSENDLQEYLRAGGRSNKYKQESLNSGKKIILTTPEEIREYTEKAIFGEQELPPVAYGKVDEKLSEAVYKYSNGKIQIENYYLELVAQDLKHAYREHSQAKAEGDIDLNIEHFFNIPTYLATYDELVYAIKYKSGNTKICVSKKINGGRALIIEIVSKSHGSIEFKNMIGVSEDKYISEYKKRNSTNTRGSNSSNNSLRDATVSTTSIPDSAPKSNSFDKNSSKNADSGGRSALARGKTADNATVKLKADLTTDTVFSQSSVDRIMG